MIHNTSGCVHVPFELVAFLVPYCPLTSQTEPVLFALSLIIHSIYVCSIWYSLWFFYIFFFFFFSLLLFFFAFRIVVSFIFCRRKFFSIGLSIHLQCKYRIKNANNFVHKLQLYQELTISNRSAFCWKKKVCFVSLSLMFV